MKIRNLVLLFFFIILFLNIGCQEQQETKLDLDYHPWQINVPQYELEQEQNIINQNIKHKSKVWVKEYIQSKDIKTIKKWLMIGAKKQNIDIAKLLYSNLNYIKNNMQRLTLSESITNLDKSILI